MRIVPARNNDPIWTHPKMRSPLSKGDFLNPIGTWAWKFPQLDRAVLELSRLATRAVKPRVVIFLHDAWFPGIECFKYISRMTGLDIRIVGFWHCGSYEPTDPLGEAGLHQWFKGSEQTWFKLCDRVLCGTEYSKRHLLAALGDSAHDVDKVIVTGYPIEVPKSIYPFPQKENLIVWPHRISPEKQPEIFDELSKDIRFQGWQFIKTKDVCQTKGQYYELLDRARIAISTSRLETFGIAMVEAATMGCLCIAPDAMAYKETLHPRWLYQSRGHLTELLSKACRVTMHEYTPGRFRQELITDRWCQILNEVGNGD